MIRQIVHKIISVWLAVLLLFGSTPKEYVHLFTGHKDTVHIHNEHGGLSFEPQHHHCSFLDLSLAAFVNDTHIPLIEYRSIEFTDHNEAAVAITSPAFVRHYSVRGPPSV